MPPLGEGSEQAPNNALTGLRVLEMGQLLAGPFAGYMLGAFGAEVVKVEPPGTGDPLRRWGRLHRDTSLWWTSLARNKQSVAIDLRHSEGQGLLRQLVASGVDVLIENFRPGRMEEWGLGYDELTKINPGLVMVRISGYGQTGPYAHKPGFANIAEAFGGLRHITGEPGRPSVRSAISLGDSLSGLHAAYAAMVALRERDANPEGRGQEVDVALYESIFNMMESVLPEYDLHGHVRGPSGARLDGVAPSNTYGTADGQQVSIGANGEAIFRRLMTALGRDDLAHDPSLVGNAARLQRADELDAVIAQWVRQRTARDVVAALEAAEVPVASVQDIAAIAADPHVAARGLLEEVTLPDGTRLKIPGIVPRMTRTPGQTRSLGPALGADTRRVLGEGLGLTEATLQRLNAAGTIDMGTT